MTTRRLAAIFAADAVGYSRLVSANEADALERLSALRRGIIEPNIAKHSGRLFKVMGDGFLAEFASAVQAVNCAIAIQKETEQAASVLDDQQKMRLQIGVHVGDVMVDGDDLMGDGVNIAARLEGIATPGGVSVSRAVHEQVRDRVGVAFEDKGEIILKNIARPVQVFVVGGAKEAGTLSLEPSLVLALPDKPSIAVLPFQNMSGDPEQDYFADGMVEDIITALSRFKSLFVIARNSSFIYKGKAVDIKQVGRELGVRYVLEGSVRKAAGKVRITGQLIDAATGVHVWADKFDGSLEDIFTLQDDVTTKVVGAIGPKLDQFEIERARRKPLQNLDAYDCILRGIDCSRNLGDRTKNEEALRLFYRAIELDPESPTAYGWAAIHFQFRKINGWIVDQEREFSEVRRLLEHALRLGRDDEATLSRAAWVRSFLFWEHANASTLIDAAIAINPNLAYAWTARSWISIYLGDHEKALDEVDRAIRLNPIDPEKFLSENARALALLFLGKYDDACYWAARALTDQPKFTPSLRIASVAHALSGRIDAAREMMRRLRQIDAVMCLSNAKAYLPFQREKDVARMLEGLRLAGMPE